MRGTARGTEGGREIEREGGSERAGELASERAGELGSKAHPCIPEITGASLADPAHSALLINGSDISLPFLYTY